MSASLAARVGRQPPVSILFAAFLGYNPIQKLLGSHALSLLSPANAATVAGRSFFPQLISGPFRSGLHAAFAFAIIACLLAAVASWSRGSRYVAGEVPAELHAEHARATAAGPVP